jgi:hypothetical protein
VEQTFRPEFAQCVTAMFPSSKGRGQSYFGRSQEMNMSSSKANSLTFYWVRIAWATGLFVLLVGLLALPANSQPPATRNAIFNGDFLDGKAGWTIGGPRDLNVQAHHKMVAHRSDSELSVQYDNLQQGMTIFSPYPIKVTPGKTYTLTLTARGVADRRRA